MLRQIAGISERAVERIALAEFVEKSRIADMVALKLNEFCFVFNRCDRQKALGAYRIV